MSINGNLGLKYLVSTFLKDVKKDFNFHKSINSVTSPKVLSCASFWLIVIHRYGTLLNNCQTKKIFKFPFKLSHFILKIIFEIASKSTMWELSKIDSPFYLSTNGGIILGANKVGEGCIIHHNVTIGMDLKENLPTIGDHVTIKQNSIIYGNISIASGTIIEEMTVLTRSIKKKSIVKGNPARIIKSEVVAND